MIIESYRDELNRKFTGVWGKENVFIDHDKTITMRLFIIRLMIIACLYLLFRFVLRFVETPLLSAFVLEYIIEPFIVEKLR